MTAEVGKAAPDFTLKDQAGNDVTLSSFKGKSAVALHLLSLHLHRCLRGRAVPLRDDYSDFENGRCAGAGRVVRQPPCATGLGRATGLHLPCAVGLLAPRRSGQRVRRLQRQLGCAIRATFLIDKSGTIVDEFQTDSLGTP